MSLLAKSLWHGRQRRHRRRGIASPKLAAAEVLEARTLLTATIIDNDDSGFTVEGEWQRSSLSRGFEGTVHNSYRGDGSDKATWTFTGLTAGDYRVSATWRPHVNRAKDAPFTLFDGSTQVATIDVNQEDAPDDFSDVGTTWEDLMIVTVTGDTLVVELSDDANEYVIADAIRIEPTNEPSIVFSISGGGTVTENSTDDDSNLLEFAVGYVGDLPTGEVASVDLIHLFGATDQSDFAKTLADSIDLSGVSGVDLIGSRLEFSGGGDQSFTFSMEVADDRGHEADEPFQIAIESPRVSTGFVKVSQQLADGLILDDDPVPSIIINNDDPGFSTIGEWNHSLLSGGYGGEVHNSVRGSGDDVASWTFTALPDGVYLVSATWTPFINRAKNAPYTLSDQSTDLVTVRVNQELAPDDYVAENTPWEKLATVAVSGGTLVVTLSDDANEYVIADAIRVEPVEFSITGDESVSEAPGENLASYTIRYSGILSEGETASVDVTQSFDALVPADPADFDNDLNAAIDAAIAELSGVSFDGTRLEFTGGAGHADRITFNLAVRDDGVDEEDESYQINLSNPTLAGLGANSVTTTITEPVAPAVQISELSPNIGEDMVSVTRETVVRFDDLIDPQTITPESFQLIAGGELVSGTIRVSSTNRFATFFYDNPLPASTAVRVIVDGDKIMDGEGIALDADGDGLPGGRLQYEFRTLPLTNIANTSVFGYIYDSYNRDEAGNDIPVVGATISLDANPNIRAVTNEDGFFELGLQDFNNDGIADGLPAPEFFVHIDGSTAINAPNGTVYATLGKPFHSIPGQRVQLEMNHTPFDVYLPPMAMGDVVDLNPDTDTEVGFGPEAQAQIRRMMTERYPDDPAKAEEQAQLIIDAMKVTYPAGSAMDEDGNPATRATIIPVDPQRLPAPLPAGADPGIVISVQAGTEAGFNLAGGSTNFDVGAPATFPNTEGLAPGDKSLIMSFDHDAGKWIVIGTGTVSEDEKQIVTDPDVGILAPGWHFTISGTTVLFNLLSEPGGAGEGDDAKFADDIPAGTVLLSTADRNRVNELVGETDAMLINRMSNVLSYGGALATSTVLPLFLDWNTTLALPTNVSREAELLGGVRTGNTLRHGDESQLSDSVRNSSLFMETVAQPVLDALQQQIAQQAMVGAVSVASGSVNIPPGTFGNPDYSASYLDLLIGDDLAFIIGGFQGSQVFLKDFNVNPGDIIVGPQDGQDGSGKLTATIVFAFADDFGVDGDDILTDWRTNFTNFDEGMIAQWILQHQGTAKPFMNEVVVEYNLAEMNMPIEFVIPDEYECVELTIDGVTSSFGNCETDAHIAHHSAGVENTSTVAGFGTSPEIYYRFRTDKGIELAGSIGSLELAESIVLPPDLGFTGVVYQPSTNRSGSVSFTAERSGAATRFGTWNNDAAVISLTDFGGIDSDGDELPDVGEYVIGTNPRNMDTDNDGIRDSAEIEQGLNPLDGLAVNTGVLSTLQLPDARTLTADGATLFIGRDNAISIVDASRFDRPIRLGDLPFNSPTAIAIDSQRKLLGVLNGEGLTIVDVADAMFPETVRQIPLRGSAMTAVDGIVYVAGNSRITAVDMSTGEVLQELALPASGLQIEFARGYLFVTTSANTLVSIQIGRFGIMEIAGSVAIGAVSTSNAQLTLGDGVAWITGTAFSSIDITNPESMTVLASGSLDVPTVGAALTGAGKAVFLTGIRNVTVRSIENGNMFGQETATYLASPVVRDVLISGAMTYVVTDFGLEVINVQPFDTSGVAPFVSLEHDGFDEDPARDGVQLTYGTPLTVHAAVEDDVQVQRVDFYQDSEFILSDYAFPFNFSTDAMTDIVGGMTTLSAVAVDTGGNQSTLASLDFEILADVNAPEIVEVLTGDPERPFEALRSVRIQFSEPIELVDVNENTPHSITITGSGDDGIWGTADDVTAMYHTMLRDRDRELQLIFDEPIGSGDYRLNVVESPFRDRSGNVFAASPFEHDFTVSDTPFNTQVTFQAQQDEYHRFTFEGHAGDIVTIVADLRADQYGDFVQQLDLTLLSSNGEVVANALPYSSSNRYSLLGHVDLPNHDNYTIVVHQISQFYASPRQIVLSISDPETEIEVFALGSSFSSVFAVPGDDKEIAFDGEAGQIVTLQRTGTIVDAFDIIAPDGSVFYSVSSSEEWILPALQLPMTGRYHFVLSTERPFSSSHRPDFTIASETFSLTNLVTAPFSDGFEVSELGPHWTTEGSAGARTITTSYGPHTGNSHLSLYTTREGLLGRSSATLWIDMSEVQQDRDVWLEFQHKHQQETRTLGPFGSSTRINETTNPRVELPEQFTGRVAGEGVAISDDGINWYRVLDLSDFSIDYRPSTINLSMAVRENGLNPNRPIRVLYQSNSSYQTSSVVGPFGVTYTYRSERTYFDSVMLTLRDAE